MKAVTRKLPTPLTTWARKKHKDMISQAAKIAAAKNAIDPGAGWTIEQVLALALVNGMNTQVTRYGIHNG